MLRTNSATTLSALPARCCRLSSNPLPKQPIRAGRESWSGLVLVLPPKRSCPKSTSSEPKATRCALSVSSHPALPWRPSTAPVTLSTACLGCVGCGRAKSAPTSQNAPRLPLRRSISARARPWKSAACAFTCGGATKPRMCRLWWTPRPWAAWRWRRNNGCSVTGWANAAHSALAMLSAAGGTATTRPIPTILPYPPRGKNSPIPIPAVSNSV